MVQQTILVVDDEAAIRNLLTIFLGAEDYTVIEADSGRAALRQVVVARPDLIVLDLGLPDMEGHDILAQVRQFSNVPIVVLTARDDDREMVRALEACADDYVVKPFSAEVLLARIRANMRRTEKASPVQDIVRNGPVEMDILRHEVRLNGTLVALTPKEFGLLKYFIDNKGRMATHKQILREVWGPAHVDDTQYLRVYIGQLREKLEFVEGLGKAIVSESGIGYRMEALTATGCQIAGAVEGA